LGMVYTLLPSAANKSALQPQEISELVYVASVDAKVIGALTQLYWVGFNMYEYPRSEQVLATMPVHAAWYGLGVNAPAKPQQLAWGQPFAIPGVNSGIVYTPVDASVQSTANGKAAIVTLLAENPGTGRELLPAFRIDGVVGQKGYTGQARTDVSSLEAGEKAYLHVVIPIEQGVTLSELLVVSTDSFVGKAGAVPIVTGKLTISWPNASQAGSSVANYSFGEPIAVDALAKLLDSQTEAALMEFTIHDNAEEGYKTAVAKFKLTNRSDSPVAAPVFGTEITNEQGVTYRGSRQLNTTQTMNPGLSYVVSYAYTLPQQEEGQRYTMKLLDQAAVAPYVTNVASFQVKKQEETEERTFSLYPFEIQVNSVSMNYAYNSGYYQYKIHLDLAISQIDNVVVDNGFSKLRFEVVDSAGRIVGTQDAALTGPKKLISGKQVLETGMMTIDSFSTPFTVNLYGIIETETGVAKRFLEKVD
ncbi:MAG: hypothetical protein K0Q59_5086, partial [Paenibacillus sp.]|nr:hypothetical protein [Paenibacillus sp.]